MKLESYALAVLHKLGDSLAVYEVGSGREIYRVPTRRFPHEMCLSPDRRRLCVTEYGLRGVESEGDGGDSVGVYDLRTRCRAATLQLGAYRRPHGIAALRSRLLVTCEQQRALLVLDADTGKLAHAVDVGQELPHVVGVSPDGRTAVTANITPGTLTAVDVEAGCALRTAKVQERPEGMAFSPDGRWLYVVNRESDSVSIVEAAGFEPCGEIATGRGPVRLAITPDGSRIAFPLFFADAVQVADTASRAVTHTIPVGRQPAGTTLSADGELLFVSCENENRVHVVSLRENRVVTTIATGAGPDAMACLAMDEVA